MQIFKIVFNAHHQFCKTLVYNIFTRTTFYRKNTLLFSPISLCGIIRNKLGLANIYEFICRSLKYDVINLNLAKSKLWKGLVIRHISKDVITAQCLYKSSPRRLNALEKMKSRLTIE